MDLLPATPPEVTPSTTLNETPRTELAIPRGMATQLASRNQLTANNEAAKCSTFATNSARLRVCLAGDGCSSKARGLDVQLGALAMERTSSCGVPGGYETVLTPGTASQPCEQGQQQREAVEALGYLVHTDTPTNQFPPMVLAPHTFTPQRKVSGHSRKSIRICEFKQPTLGKEKSCEVQHLCKKRMYGWRRIFRRGSTHAFHTMLLHQESWRPPELRDKELCNVQSSAWVNAQLAAPGIERGHTSNWSEPDGCRPAGYENCVTAETVSELCGHGLVPDAVEALGLLVQADCHVSKSLFYMVLKECVAKKDLPLGRRVHALTVKKGYHSDTFLCNHILRMYASHARLQEAMDVFFVVAKPDVFTWCAVISAHGRHGQDEQAIKLYHQMRRSSVTPNGHVFVVALQACARRADLKSGQQVHADVLGSGVEPDMFVCSCLVDMYAKCGSLEDAERVFDGLPLKDVVTWNAMMAGYSQQGMGQKALSLYSAMQEEGMAAPNSVTFVILLQACASVGISALEVGKQLHAQIKKRGIQADVVVGGSLVNMYAKCGSVEDALGVFEGLGQKTVVTWNAMIAGYSQKGMGQKALQLYSVMETEGLVTPDSVTFVCLLQACASVGNLALEQGKQLHSQIRERGLKEDVFVANSLVSMYAKCGSIEDAHGVFEGLTQKDVVTWNAMIAGYSHQGLGQQALGLHRAMQEDGMAAPDSVTFVCLLQACASVGSFALEKGKELHAQIRERGLEADVVIASSLVDMYAKCGSLQDAQGVFDALDEKNVVTWSAMIAGYSQQGMGLEALGLYSAMQEEGMVAPNSVTFVCLLQACASVAALHLGRQLHAQIKDQRLQADMLVAGSLVNMYGKCGSMVDAQQVFEALPKRDLFTWSALIAGYTRQGDSEEVFHLVLRMKDDGVQPDGITFLSVLTVCSHTGLVQRGREYFEAMSTHHGLTPTADHYTCMVDLLGRAGELDEALALVRTMPLLPNLAIWHTLLGACRKWSNLEVARHAFHEAVKLDEKDAAAYVLMSSIYTGAQMWEQAQEMQARRMLHGAWKQPGQSWWADMEGLVHSFKVGDKAPRILGVKQG